MPFAWFSRSVTCVAGPPLIRSAPMSRFTLAFACFFRLLFGKRLPADAANYLPEGAIPKQLPAPEPPPVKEPEKPRVEEKPKLAAGNHQRDGALALLALLQREGRLVDFLREPLDGFSDAEIGAAARDVHRGCRKVLEQHLSMEPVMPGAEEEKVSVPKGFDPAEIRLVGEAKGDPQIGRASCRERGEGGRLRVA